VTATLLRSQASGERDIRLVKRARVGHGAGAGDLSGHDGVIAKTTQEGSMNASLLGRRARRCGSLAAVGLMLLAGTTYGEASVGSFSFQEPISGTETGILGCLPDVTGTITGTDTVAGHSTLTPQGTHFHGTETQDYRIDFEDGRYLISYSPTHFDFNAVGPRSENTEAQQDRGTLYAANGQPIGPVTVHTLSHMTWTDANGNGQPDSGEITVDIERFRISCP
jgi:hypothetical protein